jgi:hypothetical protein
MQSPSVTRSTPETPRLTYLVLAHSDPKHLARMLHRIAGSDVNIYVHLDRKTDIEPFRKAVRDVPNVAFCDKRARVMWGGFSVVAATLNLIEAALAGSRSDYLVLLSGADYPLATRAEIAAYFAASGGRNFARLAIIPESETEILWRVRGWHFRELANRWTFRRKILKPIELALRLLPRTIKPGVRIAVGSQWWALTEETARFVLNALQADGEMRSLFKFALAPDELAFHTVLANSPYNKDGCLEEAYRDIGATGGPFYLTNFHHINRDFIESAEKAQAIMNQKIGHLFARKFKSGDSDSALDVIDAVLAEREARENAAVAAEVSTETSRS